MNLLKIILSRAVLLIVLVSHLFVYMIIPSSGNGPAPLSVINPITSYDDYLIEYILKIPDSTPRNEIDDIERTVQIARVETFAFNKLMPDLILHVVPNSRLPLLNESGVVSIYADVLVPPPQQ